MSMVVCMVVCIEECMGCVLGGVTAGMGDNAQGAVGEDFHHACITELVVVGCTLQKVTHHTACMHEGPGPANISL